MISKTKSDRATPNVKNLVTDPAAADFKHRVVDDDGFVWLALIADPPTQNIPLVEWLSCGTVAENQTSDEEIALHLYGADRSKWPKLPSYPPGGSNLLDA